MGKSSLLKKLESGQFQEFGLNPTYGMEMAVKDIEINDQKIKLQIWDTV